MLMKQDTSLRHFNSNNRQNPFVLPHLKRISKSSKSSYQNQSHSLKLIDRTNKIPSNGRILQKYQTTNQLNEVSPTQNKKRTQKTKTETQIPKNQYQKFSSLGNQEWGRTLEEFHKNIQENRKIISNQMSSIFKKKLMQRESLKKIKFRNKGQIEVSEKRQKKGNFVANINQILNRKSISYVKKKELTTNSSQTQEGNHLYDKFQSLKNSRNNLETRYENEYKQSIPLLSTLVSSCNLFRENKTIENQNERLEFLRKKTDASLQNLLQYRKAILVFKSKQNNACLP